MWVDKRNASTLHFLLSLPAPVILLRMTPKTGPASHSNTSRYARWSAGALLPAAFAPRAAWSYRASGWIPARFCHYFTRV